jgi:hypothetical protein
LRLQWSAIALTGPDALDPSGPTTSQSLPLMITDIDPTAGIMIVEPKPVELDLGTGEMIVSGTSYL